MIQRIQTIYLFLAVIFMSSLFLERTDLFKVDTSNPALLSELEYYHDMVLDVYDQNLLIILTIIALIFALFAIFLFRNRKLQIMLSRISLYSIVLLLLLVIYLTYTELQNLMDSINLGLKIGLILPVLAILMLVMAIRSIKKDEKLVKSMDRLR
ncbi:MAG TPA: DUF4293 domain-containing protein [Membranihabitans sp.]|nr:DUF4293 domain-containing protein [Membranihabitans sp.]